MTTLSYRDGIVAWDSQLTEGNSKYAAPKGVKNDEVGVIIGLVGVAHAGWSLIDWVLRGRDGPPPERHKRDDFELLLYWRTGDLELMDPYARTMPLDPGRFYAFGSGQQAALAALHLGCDATKAVEIASLCDSGTSTPVVSHSW